jgi:translation initiation factor IF-2
MSDQDQKDKGTLKISPNKLTLTKTVEGGKVQQNFQRGRSKTVTVEVRKTRTFNRGEGGAMVRDKAPEATKGLSQREQEARLQALKAAENADKKDAKKEPPRQSSLKVKERPPEPEPPVIAPPPEPVAKKAAPKPAEKPAAKESEAAKKNKGDRSQKMRLGAGGDRRGGKLTVTQALNMGDERMRSLSSVRRQREKARKQDLDDGPKEKITREVIVPEFITVQELANRMAERAVDVVKELMKMGSMVTVNQTIDADTAEILVQEMGHKVKRVSEADVENVLVQKDDDDDVTLQPRPAVVTVMGHVDHGKTSLLDALRKTDVAAGEAGGITQHIGAYQVRMPSGDKITFLDTPGHEAFTAMRSRGAQTTDVVILVVAADDGIMPQTEEAINHAKAAGVPIIVAINKMDKEGADPDRVKNELMAHELVAEEYGGDTQLIEVSAIKGTNLEKLEEAILLQAEMLELKANPDRNASGVVVESKVEQGKGTVATLLIQRGTLRVGDIVVGGSAYGKIRAMMDSHGNQLKESTPSMPVEVLGLNEPPEAGEEFAVVEDEKTAREITEYRYKKQRDIRAAGGAQSMEQLFASAGKDKVKELPLILKTDVQGSAEALAGSLQKFDSDEVAVRIVHSAVGAVSESDISLAQTTGGSIIAFNVRATKQAREKAEQEKIDIRYYSVIYDVVDDVKAALSGMLSPKRQENFIGYAEIREVFNITKVGKVAGCMVTDGQVKRGAGVRLLRDNVVIHEGKLKTLKRFKDEVKEVKSGYECGMAFENYDDIKPGDVIEAFEVEEVQRSIDDVAKEKRD